MNQAIILQNDSITVESHNNSMLQMMDEFLFNQYTNQNTIANYRRYIKKYLAFVNVQQVKELFPANINQFDQIRNLTTAFIKNYKSPSTQKFVRSIVAKFWDYIVEFCHYPKNPTSRTLKLEPVHNRSNTKSLSCNDLGKKLDSLKDYRDLSQSDFLACALAYTMAGTSLRISEVLQITTEMIDSGVIEVKQKRGQARQIEMPKEVHRILTEYTEKYNISGKVFITSRGVLISRNNATRLIKKHTGISCHGFRKSVIEGLVEKNIHPHEIAKVSGHSSAQMVSYYDNRDTKPTAHLDFIRSITKI